MKKIKVNKGKVVLALTVTELFLNKFLLPTVKKLVKVKD